MDNAIDRESQFVRKWSAVVRAQEVYITAMHLNCFGGEFSTFPVESRARE